MKKINKILIANRGEIALRIIRTCKEMGIKTVALCPQPGQEHNFLETTLADEYYFLERDGSQGYLDGKRVLEVAKAANVDAIHPGYGFLSENWKFALECEKNRIKFIGPKADTLRKFEDKVEAKKVAKKVGIPTLPASDNSIRTKKELLDAAARIKPPFILKAQRGGGGMGIRVVEGEVTSGELFAITLSIQKQMSMGFSDVDFFLEKYLPEARHIEFQVLGDGRKAIHLGERDCSVQRRFQKLIEESPSSFIDDRTRQEMGRWAVKICEEVKYEGAATVEFLVDKDKNFYFMEVNPRIQVEHPVTEAVTGVDIVEQQIRIAQGEPLSLSQEDIRINGWAIETRINAEDPFKNFQPSPGVVKKYIPSAGQGIFLHSFLHDGQQVYPYFDSLLAKVISWGKNRDEAINKLKRSLDETIIEGVPTTIPFFSMVLRNKDFVEGNFYTNFIEKSQILNQLICTPYLKKEFESSYIGDLKEEEIANLVYSIYKNIKADKKGAIKDKKVSNWIASSRNYRNY
ncbi:MAG: acetyl-CoA carboxylase biotin carboxylase subunit [Minisyncoccus archaeiphilus]|uniref:acetyl-CoA carboxylase biotin carboxylase subunit n=1 Tax=Minisyncoccus archaeiphilus TaxID=3238481 RepID=UPI0009CE0CCA|nr:MAG: Biotin carboxylase [Parcubacteria group bacterium ADurb.Bin216]GMX59599.1 MAG: acetyl-CoA carboxylase biotin carboxylase subunit [Candidatus Parcubacteria bacterium]